MQHGRWTARLATVAAVLAGLVPLGAGSAVAGAAGARSYGTSLTRTGFIGHVDVGGRPVPGGTLHVVAGDSEPEGLDPVTDTIDGDAGLTELAAIYDVLVRYDPVANRYVPQMAQSFGHNAGYTQWTIHLRPGVTFTDGTPLDAAAVKSAIERYSQPPSIQYYAAELGEVSGIDTPDDLTVTVDLDVPDPQFIWLFTQGLGLIGSPTAVQKEGEQAFDLHPVGAGPFMVQSYTPGKSLVLVRNPHYWGGAVELDGVDFTWPTDDSTKLQALDSGDLDMVHLADPTVVSKALGDGYGGFEWLRYGGATVMMNERAGHHLGDVRVRRAIADAIDPSTIDSRVFEGKAIASSSLFPLGLLRTRTSAIGYDQAKAKALLQAVKKQTSWNGSLTILASPDATQQATALTVEALLDAVGFHVTLKTAPSVSAMINDVYVTFDYDLAISGISVSESYPWGQMVEELEGSYSPDGYTTPAMTAALGKLRSAATPVQTRQATAAIQRVWDTTVPEVWLTVGQETVVWSTRVHGVVPNAQTSVLLGKVWLGK